jgi:2,3-dihydro-2,3-dihydroxybenzoate dehydrogenase
MTERVVLVTGAAGGIGRAIVRGFAESGWGVLATDIAPATEFGADQQRVRYVVADVADAEQMSEVVHAAQDLGDLTACIANAGVLTEDFSGFLNASPQAWRSTFEINVLGVLNTFQATARALADSGGGRMVATASVSGVRAEPNLAAYCASKAAVISIVKCLALELGGAGITVNAVAPGPVGTEAQLRVIESRKQQSAPPAADETPADRFERHRNEGRPISRLAKPEEIAGAMSWLLSDAAAYITGHVLVVDGGGVLV